ncbi:MAG: hypothetical protein KatS3mg054_0460 [Chloroflexus sp.]|nr:MAG: hypothetical protein KatS3mg054_0194 [Chloroflexus sp.]GIV86194.1 MAG: hypothetical protein KatS3mg054_0223 [Chloroflexus sp.]GIV86395.1 MAG: hypothetical protein KatS3mg054_0424 [Chloroflexus sp.]GIV86431.1 MAG: hypothetical protein KatS3mg054_0460 [Chloroflexus sp.]
MENKSKQRVINYVWIERYGVGWFEADVTDRQKRLARSYIMT